MPRIKHVKVMVGKVENVPAKRFARRICPGCNREMPITMNNKFLAHMNNSTTCRASKLSIEQFNRLNEELMAARKSAFN